MIKNLTKYGNSPPPVINEPVLEHLDANPKTPFDMSTDDQPFNRCPVKNPGRKEEFQSVQEVNTEYSRTLKKLSE